MHACHPVKAYDIRGRAPDEVSPELARQVGTAFVRLLDAPTILLGHDMRTTSEELAAAFCAGARAAGAHVLNAGLVSTDALYFTCGSLSLPAAMITASHNPACDNGIKLCGPGVSPVDAEHGLEDIHTYLHTGRLPGGLSASPRRAPGSLLSLDCLGGYTEYLRHSVPLHGCRPLTVVADAGNGMAGHVLPPLLEDTPITLVPLHFELDGTFPHHDADPMNPANLNELSAAVRAHGADLGLAFDGDADRCFAVDENGVPVSPAALLALFAERLLALHPGAAVVHDLLTSAATTETIEACGGRPYRSRVGHSFVKAEMHRRHAILGGETSGHFYFRDFWYADSGPLAALHLLAALGRQEGTLSRLVAPYQRYVSSGEINLPHTQPQQALAAVRGRFDGTADELDGLSVRFSRATWFNLRPSNVEPVLRLTVEGPDRQTMSELRDQVLKLLSPGT
ncbi:phosphomannomutase/phosphoglucomutase [Streptomyces sp. NPDC059629]|uniref:phosphomannomutase/phosphoglucomutase n=1 Tax=Streptomyces sp. NPDC059629 TaxID=3346889 RepID=UPI00368E4316